MHRRGNAFVLITVLETRGSTPRDDDGKMVVTAGARYDTIGGGQLEHRAMGMARDLLTQLHACKRIEEFPLGPELNQCCGGHVQLLFEYFPACGFNIQLYGAGHVAKALVSILGGMDCRVRWIDGRREEFLQQLPDNIEIVVTDVMALEVEAARANAFHIVMTHSHALDLEICEAVLGRSRVAYLGLIGSRSKSVRFRKRLAKLGFSENEIACLHCPVGIPGTGGKKPMEIAVSVAADLLKRRQTVLKENVPGTLRKVKV